MFVCCGVGIERGEGDMRELGKCCWYGVFELVRGWEFIVYVKSLILERVIY